jgi:ABC-type lipoprotein export system ATPase subunit
VIEALLLATHGRTVIVATHSAALARSADTVVIIADGIVQPAREVMTA